MKQFEQLATDSGDIGEFAQGYFNYLKTVLDQIDLESIRNLATEFEHARKNGHTIFIAGNGGSATTASSMANDIGFDIIKKTGTTVPFRVMSITDNNSVLTAIANDVGYDNVFLNQLEIHFRKGDILLAISASGNSDNIIKAAQWVKKEGGKVIAFLGFSGGKLKNIADIAVHVKTEPGEYGPVEDAHLILNHILAHWFQVNLQ